MVEKNENDMMEETVMVEAITEEESTKAADVGSQFGTYSIGAAIKKIEAKLPFQVTFSDAVGGQVTSTSTAGNQASRPDDAVHKVFMLRSLIEIGITAAIVQRKATHDSVAILSNAKDVKAGNVVSFLIHTTSFHYYYFLEIREGKTCLSNNRVDRMLSFDNDSSRFFVMESGYSGRVSFFQPIERRFLAWSTDGLVYCSTPILSMYDSPRYNETFLVDQNNMLGEKACYFQFSDNRHIYNAFSMYKIAGFDS